MTPLTSNCPDCRDNPTHQTRQKAFAARPAQAWHQCCAAHVPGRKADPKVVNRFHETRPLEAK